MVDIERRALIKGAALGALAFTVGGTTVMLTAAQAHAQDHSDTPDDLPAGVGRDETFYACTACHGVAIIVSQGMSRERWDSTIDEMIRRNAMPEPDAADRRFEVPERFLHDPRADFRREAAAAPAFVDDHRASGLAHRGENGLGIERPQHAKVDDLRIDPFS